MDHQLIFENADFFLTGLLLTFELAGITLFFATILSVIFGTMSTSRHSGLRTIAKCYVELFRNIPLIVNVLFVYFGAPLVGLSLSPFTASIVSFSVWGSANGSEMVRAGLNSVSRHQRVSAMAMGLKPWEIFWFIIGPQALLPIIPPFTGLFSLLIQATSLASMVGAMEFFRRAQIVVERTTLQEGFSPAFLIYGFVLAVYFVICASLAFLTKKMEQKLTNRWSSRSTPVQVVKPKVENNI